MSEEKTTSEEKTPDLLKKRKKPRFHRQESWRYKRIKENWRKPRGLDNKMRKKTKGWPPSPNKGYRNPKETRGIRPSGFQEVRVTNIIDLERVNPKHEAIRIAHVIGDKKRVEIVNKAKEMGIHILNSREMKKIEEES